MDRIYLMIKLVLAINVNGDVIDAYFENTFDKE